MEFIIGRTYRCDPYDHNEVPITGNPGADNQSKEDRPTRETQYIDRWAAVALKEQLTAYDVGRYTNWNN